METKNSFNLESIIQDKSRNSFFSRLKSLLFTCFLEIFKVEQSNESVRLSSKIWLIILNLSVSFQLTSFLWRSDSLLKDWKKYEIFWRLISFTRFDLLSAYLNIISEVHIFLNSSMFLLLSILLSFLILIFLGKKPLFLLKYILSKGIKLFSTLLFLPSTAILLTDIKSYLIQNETILEYSTGNTSYGNHLSLSRSVVSLIILLAINFVYENFAIEIRHSRSYQCLLAKSTSRIDVNVKLSYLLIVTMYTAIYDSHPQLYQLIVFCVFLYITLEYLFYLPYYSEFSNKLKIIVSFCELLITFAFLLGYLINDSRTILLFTIFVVPSSTFLVNWLANYRYKMIGRVNPEYSSCTLLELFLRSRLRSTKRDPEVLKLIDRCLKNFKYKNCQMAPIWETYYCIDVLEDYRLAFIKLSKCWKTSYSISQDFMIFKCDLELNSIDMAGLEDLSYMRYALIYEDLKKHDMDLCINLLKFWAELVSSGDINKLNQMVENTVTEIGKIRKGYEYLIEHFPSSSKCRETYRSFLMEICLELNMANLPMSRMNSNKMHGDSGEMNYYDENNGTLLVSGNEGNIGQIVYANSKFSEILGQNLNTIIGSNINTYIPGKYAKSHNEALTNFVDFCVKADVPFVGSLMFQTETGYLVEVEIRSRCTAIHGNVFFLAMIKKLELKRHIILINEKGVVVSYSHRLPEFINIPNFKMFHINEIFPFNPDDLQINMMYTVSYRGQKIGIVKRNRQVSKVFISVLLVYENENDMKMTEAPNKTDEEKQIFKFETIDELDKRKNFKVGFVDETNYSLHPAFSREYNQDAFAGDRRAEKSTHSSTSTTSASERYSKKILNEAVKGIKIYKIILLIFVSSKQVLTGVATSLAILLRMKIDLDEENDPSLTMFLGNIIESIISISASSRIMELKLTYGMDYDIYLNVYLNKTAKLDSLAKDISRYSDNYWKGCEASDLLKKEIVPVSYLNQTDLFKFSNLYNFITEFNKSVLIIKASNYYSSSKNKSPSKQDLYFVLANGVRYSLEFILQKAQDSIKCSDKRVEKINFSKIIILYIGISILCLSIAYVTFFVISLSRKINQLWAFLSKLTNSSYKSSKSIYTNRLSIVNGIDESELNEFILKDNGKAIKFKISCLQIWKYIWRLLIFSAISISFYLLITLYYCTEIEKYVDSRSKLVLDFSQKNALIFLMNYYVVEYFTSLSPSSLKVYFPNYYFIEDPLEKINKLVEEYKSIRNYIKKNDFESYMPNEAFSIIFEEVADDKYGYNRFGIYSGLEMFVQDTLYVSSTFNYSFHDKYTELGQDIFTNQETISALIDDKLKSKMNDTFDIIMISTIVYSVISLLLYFCVYIPYLSREESQLRRIQSLCKLASLVDKKMGKG